MAWQIYELTNSPLQIGLLGLARAIPQAILLLVAGLLADAVNRRKLMMVTQIGLFGVSLSLGLLTITGHASAPILYGATVALAIFSSLETPSRQSIIPNLVPREILPRALALQGTQRYIPVIAGPSLAGVVLAISGPAACYLVDAVSWLAMLSALAMLRTRLQEGPGFRSVSFNALREGLNFVMSHGVIFPLMLLDFGATFFGNARALFPIYARDILFVGPTGLGILYSARSYSLLRFRNGPEFFRARAPRRPLDLYRHYALRCRTRLFAHSHVFGFGVDAGRLGGGDTTSAILRTTINQLNMPTIPPLLDVVDQQHLYEQRAAGRPVRIRARSGVARNGDVGAERRRRGPGGPCRVQLAFPMCGGSRSGKRRRSRIPPDQFRKSQ